MLILFTWVQVMSPTGTLRQSILLNLRDALLRAVDDGVPMLFTGNSYDILGKGITTADGTFVEGLGIFGLHSLRSSSKSVTQAMSF